jgi:hypothetical protein
LATSDHRFGHQRSARASTLMIGKRAAEQRQRRAHVVMRGRNIFEENAS